MMTLHTHAEEILRRHERAAGSAGGMPPCDLKPAPQGVLAQYENRPARPGLELDEYDGIAILGYN